MSVVFNELSLPRSAAIYNFHTVLPGAAIVRCLSSVDSFPIGNFEILKNFCSLSSSLPETLYLGKGFTWHKPKGTQHTR